MVEGDAAQQEPATAVRQQPIEQPGAGERPATGDGSETFRNIVLFSDGTGNSSAKLFKTNVWRMYEAVDLGPPEAGERKQIAFYDNGVGTSAFKPIAALGAVFGIGLRRNVLDIYRYACRNYRPGPGQNPGDHPGNGGDYIYGFGFSRGAFTMRVVIDLIGSQGLVSSRDESELLRKSEEAWRAYRELYLPRRWSGLTKAIRAAGKAWRRLREGSGETYDRSQNYRPVIQFLGVWDTVGAYGGPITEIIRAFDNWFVRLTMIDYKLGADVRCARHALSIDDERDAFRPLLWDEIAEQELRDDPDMTRGRPWLVPQGANERRIEQVWFTGMHADVGGGYPDESLSFVSFLWMMEEAKKAKLRPVPAIVDRFRALASSDGPIHDSRAGFGSYYRYQPRKIGAWLEPIDPSTLAQRDPDQKSGLIKVVKIHESVAARIASGTDRYAPITLPAEIRIVPPQAEGENAPLETEAMPADDAPSSVAAGAAGELTGKPRPLISQALRRRLEDPVLSAARVAAMEPAWRLVAKRRFLYFATLTLTLLLIGMPLWIGALLEATPSPPVFATGHGLLGAVIGVLGAILPVFLSGLVATWAANPFYVAVLVAGIVLARARGTRLERKLRDQARKVWDEACSADSPLAQAWAGPAEALAQPPDLLQRLRIRVKWSLLPAIIALLLLAVAAWLLLVTATRATLAVRERTATLCERSTGALQELTVARAGFTPRAGCVPMGTRVKAGETYVVDFDVRAVWYDGKFLANPAGLQGADIGFFGTLAAPLRRAVAANYLQPVAHIRTPGEWWAGPSIVPLQLVQQGGRLTRWRGSFVAPRSGELSLFANDLSPAIPLPVRTSQGWKLFRTEDFYGNNRGSARVTIVHADRILQAGGRTGGARDGVAAPAPGAAGP